MLGPHPIQERIFSPLCQQLMVFNILYNSPTIQHSDPVGHAYRAKTMRNLRSQSDLHRLVRPATKSTKWFVYIVFRLEHPGE